MLSLLAAVAALSTSGGSAAYQSAKGFAHSQIGFAKVDITPPELLPLGGYTERRGKIMDPGGESLFCRTVFLRQGNTKVAITSTEMLTIPESLYREVLARIPKDVHLFLAATHTHCAPDSQMLNDRMTMSIPGIATYKRRWLRWYADRLATSVTEAETNLGQPRDTLNLHRKRADLNRNRRNGPEPDKSSTKICLGGADIVHYAAHPTLFGPEWNKTNGDWPGAVSKSGDTVVLLGPIGDVSPKSKGATPQQQIAFFARNVTDWSTGNSSPSEPIGTVRFSSAPIALDAVTPHPGFAKTYGIPDALASTVVAQFAPTQAAISAIGIGKIAVVGVPGEPTAELGRRIQAAGKAMGFTCVLTVSHVNGWIGYILAPKDYDTGGYEATLSFHGRLTGDRVVDAAKNALRQLATSGSAVSSRRFVPHDSSRT